MDIYKCTITMSGAALRGESFLPVLRDMGDARQVKATEELEKQYSTIGSHANYRVLPYTMQNNYGREQETVSLKAIVYENEHLEAIFLPEYGGRLYSLFHKKYKRHLLHVNPVFQPANLAIRNAWFSGGIEWNIGHFGHSCLTCECVFFATCTNEREQQFLRMYEYERMKKLFYQIDFYLPVDSDVLVSYTRVINPYDETTPLYYWSNISVNQVRNARIFAGARGHLYGTFFYGQKWNNDEHLCMWYPATFARLGG